MRQRVDEHIRANGLDAPDDPPSESPAAIAEPPREVDLRSSGITTVIWANGYRPDFSWIDLPLVDEMGWPRQRRGVSEHQGLFFVGLHWMHKRKSALLLGVGEDAEHVASVVATA